WDNLPDNMESLKSLRSLDICHCYEIDFLPTLPDSLKYITIYGNRSLYKSCKEEGSPNWDKIQHIPFKNLISSI
ncbi:hypothetical protein Q6247_27125, partial [Klebsiella pneumoniae]